LQGIVDGFGQGIHLALHALHASGVVADFC
jgi:hypothetical protein